jgi:NAD(P)-dependent dehydrogenase (short-subunit alcohol dehydrogenase family)
MTGRVEDKVCIVTGGARNIGRAIAERLGEEGAKVAVVDLNERGADIADDINDGEGGEALFVECDVTDEDAVEAMIEQVVDRWGTIDGLVNNVAYAENKSVLECSEAEWDRVMDVTLKSSFLCTKHVVAEMKETDGGSIVNIASTSGHRGTPEKVAYCTAKGGLLNFTRQTAVDLAEHDIRVNTETPTRTGSAVGFEEGGPGRTTEGILRARLGEPLDHANATLFLLSDEADFINGTELVVDGGYLASY